MEVTEAIRTRQSIRDYEDRPIPKEKLQRVLEAARLAPSARNRQRWKILAVPEDYRIVVLLTLGFPKGAPGPKSRKPLDAIVCYETFTE